jgi:hypothetical protein
MLGGIELGPDATTPAATTILGLSKAVECHHDARTNRPACVDLFTAGLDSDVERVSVEPVAPAVYTAAGPTSSPRTHAAVGAGRTGRDR